MRVADDPGGDAQCRPGPKRTRQPADGPAPHRAQGVDRPFRCQRSGPRHHSIVSAVFLPQEGEDRSNGREPNRAAPETFGIQPTLLVELQPERKLFSDGLVKTRGEQSAGTMVCHDAGVERPDVTAAILAGGLARRLGGLDKSRLMVEGQRIIDRQVEILQRLTGRGVIIANDAERFVDLGVPVHADVRPGLGPIGGLLTALRCAAADLVLVVACDLPFLHLPLLIALADRAQAADGAWIRTSRGVDPLLACYRSRLAPVLEAHIDDGGRSLYGLASMLRMHEIDELELARLGAPARVLANINTPEDYARIQYPPA